MKNLIFVLICLLLAILSQVGITITAGNDNRYDPPTPNPMTWAVESNALSPTEITMTATTATDANSPPVMCYFECTTDGDANSDWQLSETYVAQGLNPSTSYTFRIKARDSAAALNETGWSSTESATTQAIIPGNTKNILLTGYWPPTNEMLRKFSTNPDQNPDGWQGQNWEGRGYDVYAYFPEFPGGSSKGTGDFEVDYQDVSEDFWRITNDLHPVAILSYGAGAGPWEIEYNARNLSSWSNDYESPRQPTPAPPDDSVPAGYVRNSTLPVQAIADAINNAGIGVSAWVDWSGNPGAFLCEYMAYHDAWYQSLHSDASDSYRCLVAGFTHVASSVSVSNATAACEIALRQTIYYLDSQLEPSFTLTVDVVGNGSVLIEPDLPSYDPGTEVTLTADADPGWHFDHWEGDLTGSTNPTSILMDNNKNVTAVFEEDAPPQVATPDISPASGTYPSPITITMSCSTVGVTIRYTTNGSEPNESSAAYAGPVQVSGSPGTSKTVKAKAFKPNWNPSEVKSADYVITGTVVTPTFSPDTGTYTSPQNVTVSCTTSEATIHYTTDGSIPSESDPVVASGGTVLVDHSLTLKAKAFKSGWPPSLVKSADYIIGTISIFGIEISVGWDYGEPNAPNDLTYEFYFGTETNETVNSVEVETPAGYTFAIPNDVNTLLDDVQTWYYVEEGTHYWEYEGRFADQNALADYGDGNYIITVHYANGGQAQTTVLFGDPDTGDPIPQPTQEPVLTSPEHNGTAQSPVTFRWEDCYDANATSIWLGLEKQDANEVEDVNFPADVNSSGPVTLSEGMWEAALCFDNWYNFSNADDIPVEVDKYSESDYTFEVLSNTVSVYRFWSPVNSRHFYTIEEAEKDKLINIYAHVWTYESIAYYAFETDSEPGLVPVYRFWSPVLIAHFYTISESERDKLINIYPHVWTYEGVAYYAYPEGQQPQDTLPVYRFWSPVLETHFYTMDETEKNKLIDNYSHVWTYESIAWYAYE